MSLSLYEQETVILFNEESGDAELYTASGRVINHLKKAGLKPYKVEGAGHFYQVPKSAVRIKPGKNQLHIGGRRQKCDLGSQAAP